MKKLILKCFIFVSPLVFSQPLLDRALRHSNCSLNYPEWNAIVDSKINADLIIQGNSRAWVHISPRVLDSVFNITTYNLGVDGYHFTMQYYRFLLYMKYNKKPKYIIQTADYHTLGKGPDLWMYEQFIPYLNEEIIQEAVIQYNGLDYKDLHVPFYKYVNHNDVLSCAFKSLTGESVRPNGKYKGFQTFPAHWDSAFSSFKKANPNGFSSPIDEPTLKLFDTFVNYCVDHDIKLIFINSPSYYEATELLTNRAEIDSIYNSYSIKYNIPFLDYTNDSIGLDTVNFYNSQHMNTTGVIKFNATLSNDLKEILE